ncbi:MAG: exodeoxyribonuclease VII large subunit [Geobacteraceae bacterium]|nr:exodeoxyribonuclease VII large subunit [Geobacteraceae bacterium]
MSLFEERTVLTVSRLTGLIRGVLEENFEHVWVEGEVSNLALPSSGHLYFSLKDAGAQIRCVMFRASARALRFKLQNGMMLVVRGRVSVYDQRGEYQFLVEYLEPKGVGALQLAFIQLKDKLAKEGLFDESRKKRLPGLPLKIGIVTSTSGAALHDILTVLRRRHAGVDVLISPVKVQGEGAAEEIAGAIRDFNRYGDVDVMIVGRGGGSMEDLWAFNEEVVARAVFSSRIPVISAVGHEVDFTIADLAADLRAPTPSAAAEMVVKSREELENSLRHLSHRLFNALDRRMSACRERFDGLVRSLKDPMLLVGNLFQRIDDLQGRMQRAMAGDLRLLGEGLSANMHRLRLCHPALAVERCREKLLALDGRMNSAFSHNLDGCRERASVNAARLHAYSPLATLLRGYSIVRKPEGGMVIRDSRQVDTGDRLEVLFGRGSAECVVEKKLPEKNTRGPGS